MYIYIYFFYLYQASDLYVCLASPSQLQPKPDAETIANNFGKYFTDHMLKIFWHKGLGGWQKPEITPMENLVIHPASKVLHYAVEVSVCYKSMISMLCFGKKCETLKVLNAHKVFLNELYT